MRAPEARARRIAEIEARLKAATPGPWRAATEFDPMVFAGDMHVADIRGWGHLTGVGGLALSYEHAVRIQTANAELIAHAPDDIAFLLSLLPDRGAR